MTIEPYNPLEKSNLGDSVAHALLSSEVKKLTSDIAVPGAGIYTIYYTGPFDLYAPIAKVNRSGQFCQPIYVGKAIPKGARKGGVSLDSSKGHPLRDRLRQHANSISEVGNIDLDDFYFRSLVVDDIWIPLGENILIELFQPVWNCVIDGFGNKDPGRGRSGQRASVWDTLHPGRKFARPLSKSDDATTQQKYRELLREHFRTHPPRAPANIEQRTG